MNCTVGKEYKKIPIPYADVCFAARRRTYVLRIRRQKDFSSVKNETHAQLSHTDEIYIHPTLWCPLDVLRPRNTYRDVCAPLNRFRAL